MKRKIKAISYSGKTPKHLIPKLPTRKPTNEGFVQAALYKKMYACLCVAISGSIDLMDSPQNIALAKSLLQQALWEAEELYVSHNTEYRI